MIAVRELRAWLGVLTDETMVGIDDGGLTLQTEDGAAYLEIGGLPVTECGHCGAPVNEDGFRADGDPDTLCSHCERAPL